MLQNAYRKSFLANDTYLMIEFKKMYYSNPQQKKILL